MVKAFKAYLKKEGKMKRIFLTSGLVLCMACPAFADLTADGKVAGNGTGAGTNAACTEPTLLGTTGTSTFTAKWTDISHTITLDANSATNYGAPYTTNVNPTVLYSEYGQNKTMYQTRTGEGTTASPFYYSNPITVADTDVISTDPIGKQITLTIDYGMGYVNTNYNNNGGSAYSRDNGTDTENRPFKGFWASASSEDDVNNTSTLYIDTDGQVTAAGYAAATGSDTAQTWFAHYNCAQFSAPTNPELTGYTFNGWYKDSARTEANKLTTGADWCYNANDTVYAKWTPTSGYSITYDCGASTDANVANNTVPAQQTNITYDTSVTLRSNTCTYAGRKFAGWSCDYNIGTGDSNNGYETTANHGSAQDNGAVAVVFRSTNNVTCKAIWTDNTIGLAWMADTGDGEGLQEITTEGTNDTCTYGDVIPMPTNPTRPGYTFAGWEVVNTPEQQ